MRKFMQIYGRPFLVIQVTKWEAIPYNEDREPQINEVYRADSFEELRKFIRTSNLREGRYTMSVFIDALLSLIWPEPSASDYVRRRRLANSCANTRSPFQKSSNISDRSSDGFVHRESIEY